MYCNIIYTIWQWVKWKVLDEIAYFKGYTWVTQDLCKSTFSYGGHFLDKLLHSDL